MLSKKIFEFVVNKVFASMLCEVIEQENEYSYLVKDQDSTYRIKKFEDGFWHCNCNFYAKCHIGCRHLFRLFCCKRWSLTSIIGKRWISSPIKSEIDELKMGVFGLDRKGRPRNSNRNRTWFNQALFYESIAYKLFINKLCR